MCLPRHTPFALRKEILNLASYMQHDRATSTNSFLVVIGLFSQWKDPGRLDLIHDVLSFVLTVHDVGSASISSAVAPFLFNSSCKDIVLLLPDPENIKPSLRPVHPAEKKSSKFWYTTYWKPAATLAFLRHYCLHRALSPQAGGIPSCYSKSYNEVLGKHCKFQRKNKYLRTEQLLLRPFFATGVSRAVLKQACWASWTSSCKEYESRHQLLAIGLLL